MWINTTRFGRIDVDSADLLTFQSGLPGLEQCREWALLAEAENDALGWLQCTARDDIAVAVVSPRRFVPHYQVRIPRSELTPLRLHDICHAQLVVVVSKNNKGLTLNLKAPIVINLEDRTGRQVVANGDLSLDQQLDHTLATLKKSA